MKIATWNVNGIRAREAQVLELVSRERPDVLCLQEIKAPPSRVPASLCELEGYFCLWHGENAYSGVGLHVRRDAVAATPAFVHPPFDMETRIAVVELPGATIASVYVPNGGKDYAAKLRFIEAILRGGLVDVGRAADPTNDALFTYWAPWRNLRQRNIGWRIDYVLASESLAARARRCAVLADFGTSDHAPVVAEFG